MTFHCGYMAIVGQPNVGKSTLLNQLVGESVAIVTPKPQTTRQRIVGIVHRPDAQLIIVDTPGLHESARLLNQQMGRQVQAALADADIACLVVEPKYPVATKDLQQWEQLGRHPKTLAKVVINKMDLLPARLVAETLEGIRSAFGQEPLTLSALRGTGIKDLLTWCFENLPEGPALFADDIYTEHPMRFLAAEIVREQATLRLGQELPYAIAVEIEAYEEKEALTRIHATILVERESQKGIVIGKGGAMIKQIGQSAREKIEPMVGTKVFLELQVRVEEEWSKSLLALQRLGYIG